MSPFQRPDILQRAATESAGRVAWAIKAIADHDYQVRPPPQTWAGRDDLIKAAQKVYEINDELEAAQLSKRGRECR